MDFINNYLLSLILFSPALVALVIFFLPGNEARLIRWTALVGSLFFWLFPFGSRINPSDRLTLFLFALAALIVLTGVAVLIRFKRMRPIVREEALDGR